MKSLRDSILSAKSTKEVLKLVNMALDYQDISKNTRTKISKASKYRVDQLTGQQKNKPAKIKQKKNK